MTSLPAFLSLDPYGDSAEPGRGAAFLVLLAFLLAFLFIRTSARMIRAQVSWWPGNVETSSGLHLHHLVWGISLMLTGGFVAFALSTPADPWFQLCAVAFGIGAGLTFDEFALWVHLEDVYWSRQGRASLDAVVLVTTFMALVLIGSEPFGLADNESPELAVLGVLVVLALACITFMKGRIELGVVAVFLPIAGLWAALRLGKPGSPWARRFYSEEKVERARRRFPPDGRAQRLRDAFFNAIGGRPSEPDPDPVATPASAVDADGVGAGAPVQER